jgi:hypothetical protein
MTSPIAGLAWEMWRRGRRAASFAAGLLAVCSLTAVFNPNKNWSRDYLYGVFIFLMVWSFFLLFSVFHYAEHNRKNNWHGFPYRLFVLPVPTLLLIALPMVLGGLAVELFYLAWARCVFEPLGKSISYWPGMVLGAGLISYQSLVWCLAGFRTIRIISLGLAGVLFMSLGMVPITVEAFPRNADQSMLVARVILVASIVLAFFSAWLGVERQRRGGGRGRGWVKLSLEQTLEREISHFLLSLRFVQSRPAKSS